MKAIVTTSLVASTALVPVLGALALVGLIPLCFYSYFGRSTSTDQP